MASQSVTIRNIGVANADTYNHTVNGGPNQYTDLIANLLATSGVLNVSDGLAITPYPERDANGNWIATTYSILQVVSTDDTAVLATLNSTIAQEATNNTPFTTTPLSWSFSAAWGY
jgi:hypothetical protein